MDLPKMAPDSAVAREAKNAIVLSGAVQRVLDSIMATREPDHVHALLVGLVHETVDVTEHHMSAQAGATTAHPSNHSA